MLFSSSRIYTDVNFFYFVTWQSSSVWLVKKNSCFYLQWNSRKICKCTDAWNWRQCHFEKVLFNGKFSNIKMSLNCAKTKSSLCKTFSKNSLHSHTKSLSIKLCLCYIESDIYSNIEIKGKLRFVLKRPCDP